MQTPRRILIVSDTVVPELSDPAGRDRLGAIDLVISCGDLPPEYLKFLLHVFGAPLFYVRGNHDIRYEQKPPEGCLEIHGRICQAGALRMLGLGGSRWYNGGPNQYTEKEMRRLIRRLRLKLWWNKGVDMVITHAPPRHVHDAEDLCHRGFRSFGPLIEKYQPAFFLHGHIHALFDTETERVTRIGRTRVINCYGYYLLDMADHELD